MLAAQAGKQNGARLVFDTAALHLVEPPHFPAPGVVVNRL
jgi:hypothetical protein